MSGDHHLVRVLTHAGARTLPPAELPAVLLEVSDAACPVTWIHAGVEPPVVEALDEMGLDEIALKSLREGPERPRVEEFADHLYVSLFSAEGPVGRKGECAAGGSTEAGMGSAGADAMGTAAGGSGAQRAGRSEPGDLTGDLPRLKDLRLFLGPRWVISVGDVSEADYEVVADRIRRQVFARRRGASFIVYHICEWLVETLQPTLEHLDDRIDALEDEVVLATETTSMHELFSLKRDLVDLRRRVAPLRDVMQRLGSHGVLYVDQKAEVYFRDVHDDVMRVIELLDTYRDILSSALDLHLSSVSNRLNRVMKKLTVVATMFMPLSFIVGLFGTNFEDMPFHSFFWFIMMFVFLLVSAVIMILYSWRKT
jgi:magnesium/cobalt transport protein CorA